MKTKTVYKLFRTMKTREGLYPLFIGKTEPTPMGTWVPARFIPTKGFAKRPGWHVGVAPQAPHLMRKDGTMASDRVWAECEIPADVDWQPMADMSPTKDITGEVPVGGYYRFKRPANQGGEWLIAGALRVVRVLSDSDVSAIVPKEGQCELCGQRGWAWWLEDLNKMACSECRDEILSGEWEA